LKQSTSTKANRWQLPDGVDQVLPPRAQQLELLRRDVLDLCRRWGYDLIKTPLIEFLDSLHIVPSQELVLSTFTLVDQLSGRTMGVRADITSQAARIDAHVLQRDVPTRVCYADTVLRTRPQGQLGSRCPHLVGAELYGHSGVESDLEVISLLLHTLEIADIERPLLAIGHSNICRGLLQAARLAPAEESALFAALQNKATADVERLLAEAALEPDLHEALRQLPGLHGTAGVLVDAHRVLAAAAPPVLEALRELETLASALQQRFPDQRIHLDLCELRGYDYHTGVIFSAYVEGHGGAIANGGRYDGIGGAFGRARPATGFDADLLTLLRFGRRPAAPEPCIYAPASDDPALHDCVRRLRSEGRRVMQGFGAPHDSAAGFECSEQLSRVDGVWQVVPVPVAASLTPR
jgi:ATP phosphoribosyltransferase regulatory subunit